MKYQPGRDYVSNDVVMTPDDIALAIVRHFSPEGRVMDPCSGDGAFIRAFESIGIEEVESCEILEGTNFLDYNDHVDWIITNPPWSKIRQFLSKGMEVADNVVYFLTVNHLWTKARYRMIRENGFGIREICILDAPKELNNSGFVCGAIWIQRGYSGYTTICELEDHELTTIVEDDIDKDKIDLLDILLDDIYVGY